MWPTRAHQAYHQNPRCPKRWKQGNILWISELNVDCRSAICIGRAAGAIHKNCVTLSLKIYCSLLFAHLACTSCNDRHLAITNEFQCPTIFPFSYQWYQLNGGPVDWSGTVCMRSGILLGCNPTVVASLIHLLFTVYRNVNCLKIALLLRNINKYSSLSTYILRHFGATDGVKISAVQHIHPPIDKEHISDFEEENV